MVDTPDSLATYNLKRNFAKTSEPAGTLDKRKGNLFVVQKHDARALHYDLRLEMEGVLKSWAVARGPSPDPADKRLAIRTEDHPISYADFEGSIPKGEYGGGTVMLWDRGTWSQVLGKATNLSDGKLHFILDGERMKGEWLLVRIRGKKGEKRENWLLRKIEDGHAGGSDDLTGHYLISIKTGRTMNAIAADEDYEVSSKGIKGKLDNQTLAKAGKQTQGKTGGKSKSARSLPGFRKPQLATLADSVPTGKGWLHEIKYDGYRCLLTVAGSLVKIFTRSGKDWTDRFTDIAEAASALDLPPSLIDGEIVKVDGNGNPNFSELQKALKNGNHGFTLFAFDLLVMDGEDLTALTTVERKSRLAALIPPDNSTIRFADHLTGSGEKLYTAMCDAGQEGIISKLAEAPYRHERTRSWLKIKCTKRQEFVIVGWRESDKKNRPFASILLAQYENSKLVYMGRCGTGFREDVLDMLSGKFAQLARKTPPVDVPKAEARDAHWITPRLVAEIAFAQFTTDGRVRHGSFLGLRTDKNAIDITPEKAVTPPDSEPTAAQFEISSRDRLIFPDAKATKGDLADYYQAVAPLMLPWLANRPISLVRCPQGRAGKCFFQRHHAESFGESVKAIPITEKGGGIEEYLFVEDAAGLLACVQMGTIEFHGWGSRIDPLEKPDRMVFDLDPDKDMDFAHVRKAAMDIHRQLADIGLMSYAMLSGGKGIHVVVPLSPQAEWPQVKDFASRFAKALSQAQPKRYTATMSKQKREGKIFIDWLRNQRGSTSVLPFSARASQGAPVAAPVDWEELRDIKTPACFTINDAESLVRRAASADLKYWGTSTQVLPDL